MLNPRVCQLLGSAGIAICIVGLIWSFGWSGMKSPECHQTINADTMAVFNYTPPDGKTLCDRGDEMSTTLWWMSSLCGAMGLVFTYKGLKEDNP
jgi:hypothetical protein